MSVPNQISIYCGNALLADGARDGSTGLVEMLSINGQALVEDGVFLDAPWMQFFDRFTKSNAMQFRISTVHADAVDCLAFAGALRENIAGVIDLTITLGLTSGKSVTLYGANAKWDKLGIEMKGCSSIVTYPVTAGRLVTLTEGSGGTPLAIPYLSDNSINPLVIPTGFAASAGSGEDVFSFGVQCSGTLTVNSGARCFALGRS